MKKFHITHRDKDGIEHEYDGIFKCAIDAVRDCVKTFGIGRVRVDAINEQQNNMPEAA